MVERKIRDKLESQLVLTNRIGLSVSAFFSLILLVSFFIVIPIGLVLSDKEILEWAVLTIGAMICAIAATVVIWISVLLTWLGFSAIITK